VAVEVTGEPRRLGALGKGLLGLGVVLSIALVLATSLIAWRGKERRAATEERATKTREMLREIVRSLKYEVAEAERIRLVLENKLRTNGQTILPRTPNPDCELRRGLMVHGQDSRGFLGSYGAGRGSSGIYICANGTPMPLTLRDSWGHPLVYECPGPVHRNGWDIYSVGPNGVDEGGLGDDILVGEDVADVGSGQ
jgi:hypothetical protein